MEIIDISVPVVEGEMPIYPGNPGLSMRFHKSFDAGDDVCLTEATIGVHTGTHLDAPMHYLHDAGGIETLNLETLMGPARVIAVENHECITAEELATKNLEGATRFLIKTRNSEDQWWSKPYSPDYCHMTAGAGQLLYDHGMELLGVDYLGVDAPDPNVPVHTLLMPLGVVLLEGLNLANAPEGDYELIALPALLPGRDGAPARAVLRSL